MLLQPSCLVRATGTTMSASKPTTTRGFRRVISAVRARNIRISHIDISSRIRRPAR